LTVYSVLSLVTGLSCHHRLTSHPAKLDASVGASGPHDFAVRGGCRSSAPVQLHVAPDTITSIASRPTFVTTRTPLLLRPDIGEDGGDLGSAQSGIFFVRGLDDPKQVEFA
jgi:hypothetical protein